MKLKLKIPKLLKTKHYIKTATFLLFYNKIYFNTKNQLLIEKNLKELKIKNYKIYNTLIIKTIKNSIYTNIEPLINNLIFIMWFNKINKNLYLKTIKKLNPLLVLLCVKLNNKIYSKLQIIKLNNSNFQKNAFIVYKKLKLSLKINYYKFVLITNNFSK